MFETNKDINVFVDTFLSQFFCGPLSSFSTSFFSSNLASLFFFLFLSLLSLSFCPFFHVASFSRLCSFTVSSSVLLLRLRYLSPRSFSSSSCLPFFLSILLYLSPFSSTCSPFSPASAPIHFFVFFIRVLPFRLPSSFHISSFLALCLFFLPFPVVSYPPPSLSSSASTSSFRFFFTLFLTFSLPLPVSSSSPFLLLFCLLPLF